MPETALQAIFARQQHAFAAAPMPSAGERRQDLECLLHLLHRHQADFVATIAHDFGHRAEHETRLLEWLPLVQEIRHLHRHLPRWMRARSVPVNAAFRPGRARILPQPLGVVGIMGAWNYPLLLTLSPLANALAAGNRVLVKPSERAPATAALLARLLARHFAEDKVATITGGAEVAAAFAALPFNHLLFTGSTATGRKVMQIAAANLTPVTLELGGKSPALIHPSFDIGLAAERILSAKLWNAGQTCIAPDYVLLAENALHGFVEAAKAVVARRWPAATLARDCTRMIDPAASQRMQQLLDDARAKGARIIALGESAAFAAAGAFPPCLILDPGPSMLLMQEEIFGPLLPLVCFRQPEQALAHIRAGERPLALYYFDNDHARIRHVLDTTHAGGVTVNDCLFHIAQHHLPFGGIGASGIGAYHGETGFRTFSHHKAVLLQSGLVAQLLGRLIKPPYGPHLHTLLRFLART